MNLPFWLQDMNYFFLLERNSAAPATANTAMPAIGAMSPVFAAFAFVVVLSCPVWVALLLVVGVSVSVPSTATKLSIAACTDCTATSTSS